MAGSSHDYFMAIPICFGSILLVAGSCLMYRIRKRIDRLVKLNQNTAPTIVVLPDSTSQDQHITRPPSVYIPYTPTPLFPTLPNYHELPPKYSKDLEIVNVRE
jgi:hypothetical protein